MPFDALERWIGQAPAHVSFLITERGGHVGFIARRQVVTRRYRDVDRYWAENRAVQFCCWFESAARAR